MRTLYSNEIECRIGTQTSSGVSLLLYKDARVDMRILDEEYGALNWQRRHEVVNGNLFCTIEVWDKDKNTWVAKQDVGTESFAEKEKGEASDAFKRAGFNWGVGRELYSAPFIWVNISADEFDNKGRVKTRFFCKEIGYNENREINHLVITDNKGNARFTFGKPTKRNNTLLKAIDEIRQCQSREDMIACWNKYPDLQTEWEFKNLCTELGKKYPKTA